MPEHVVEFDKAAPSGGLDAAAFHRNHEPIWSVLSQVLHGRSGNVLELASGTGQHVVTFARQSPDIVWWPTDLNDKHLQSIAAWRAHAGLANVRAPVRIDLAAPDWRLADLGLPGEFTAMFCANVLHISPWSVSQGLFAGAGRHLADDGRLMIYGPFKRDGAHNAPSNAAFDANLRADNPEWGVRDTADLRALAQQNKLELADIAEMPANNAILVFERVRR